MTITTALLGALAFTAWAIAAAHVGAAVGGLLATLGIGFYLRNLRARLDAKLTPRAPAR